MSTPLNTDLDVLRGLCESVDELERTVAKLRRFRDERMRALRDEGYSVIRLATATQMGRSRVYQIVDAPSIAGDEEDQAEAYRHWSEHVEDLLIEAHERWADNGYAGSPDDYFALGEIVESR